MAEQSQPPKIVVDSDWKTQAQAERERLAKAEAQKRAVAGGPLAGEAAGRSERAERGAAVAPASGEKAVAVGGAGGREGVGERSVGGTAGGAGGAGGAYEAEPLPPADFPLLVGTLFTQAYMYLGGFPDPETGRAVVSLDHAKMHIDLLNVLEQKTKGNLSDDEQAELTQALGELRLRYVEVTKLVAEMAARKQGLSAGGGGVAGAGGAAAGGVMFGGGGPGRGPGMGPGMGGFGPRGR